MSDKITDQEKTLIETLKQKRLLATTNAEKMVAQAEIAELQYRNFVLQLFNKYNLKETDVIHDDGTIVKNYKEEEKVAQ